MAKTGYEEIAAKFRQRIHEGELTAGDPMPSQREVAAELGTTITTVNRAWRMLKNEGLAYTKPGIGTVVSSGRHQVTGAARLDRLSRTGRSYAHGESSTRHRTQIVPCADSQVTDALDMDPRDEIVVRTRVFTRDGKPAVFAMSCIHPRVLASVPEVGRPERMPKFWQEIYSERTGETITRSPEQRTARLAWDYELRELEVEAPPHAAVPVLLLRNMFYDSTGPIEVWEDVYAPGLPQIETSQSHE